MHSRARRLFPLSLLQPILLLFCAAAIQAQDSPKWKVWAISDGIRIDPVGGTPIERYAEADHTLTKKPNYRERNSIWDANKRLVSLQAARNEWVSFQLIVELEEDHPNDELKRDSLVDHKDEIKWPKREGNQPSEWDIVDISPISFCLDGQTDCGNSIVVEKLIEGYIYVESRTRGYETTSLGRGWYPDPLVEILTPKLAVVPGQRTQAYWFDIWVPDRATNNIGAGKYRATFTVTPKSDPDKVFPVTVELDVYDFELPKTSTLDGGLYNNSMRDLKWPESAMYFSMLKEHRVRPLIHGLRPRPKFKNKAGKCQDEPPRATDRIELCWKEYDKAIGNYMHVPSLRSTGVDHSTHMYLDYIVLPFAASTDFDGDGTRKSIDWPVRIDNWDGPKESKEAIDLWRQTARAIKRHFEENSEIRKSRKIVFLNGLDECKYPECYSLFERYASLLGEELGKGWFQFRVDGNYDPDRMQKLRDKVAENVDLLWVWHTVGFDHERARTLNSSGLTAWFYGPMLYERFANKSAGSNYFIDVPLLVTRALGWIAWRYNSGWMQWEFDNVSPNPERPSPFERPSSGDGFLIYPGSHIGQMKSPKYDQRLNKYTTAVAEESERGAKTFRGSPVPSIRLKELRRGLQDYEYFVLLEKHEGGREMVDSLVRSIIHGNPFGPDSYGKAAIWNRDPVAWDDVRRLVGSVLSSEAHKAVVQ